MFRIEEIEYPYDSPFVYKWQKVKWSQQAQHTPIRNWKMQIIVPYINMIECLELKSLKIKWLQTEDYSKSILEPRKLQT